MGELPVPYMRQTRKLNKVASKGFTQYYLTAFGIAALIGLLIGIVWVIAGILHFHPLS
jgi:predicted PurR-regulated permease PerM